MATSWLTVLLHVRWCVAVLRHPVHVVFSVRCNTTFADVHVVMHVYICKHARKT